MVSVGFDLILNFKTKSKRTGEDHLHLHLHFLALCTILSFTSASFSFLLATSTTFTLRGSRSISKQIQNMSFKPLFLQAAWPLKHLQHIIEECAGSLIHRVLGVGNWAVLNCVIALILLKNHFTA